MPIRADLYELIEYLGAAFGWEKMKKSLRKKREAYRSSLRQGVKQEREQDIRTFGETMPGTAYSMKVMGMKPSGPPAEKPGLTLKEGENPIAQIIKSREAAGGEKALGEHFDIQKAIESREESAKKPALSDEDVGVLSQATGISVQELRKMVAGYEPRDKYGYGIGGTERTRMRTEYAQEMQPLIDQKQAELTIENLRPLFTEYREANPEHAADVDQLERNFSEAIRAGLIRDPWAEATARASAMGLEVPKTKSEILDRMTTEYNFATQVIDETGEITAVVGQALERYNQEAEKLGYPPLTDDELQSYVNVARMRKELNRLNKETAELNLENLRALAERRPLEELLANFDWVFDSALRGGTSAANAKLELLERNGITLPEPSKTALLELAKRVDSVPPPELDEAMKAAADFAQAYSILASDRAIAPLAQELVEEGRTILKSEDPAQGQDPVGATNRGMFLQLTDAESRLRAEFMKLTDEQIPYVLNYFEQANIPGTSYMTMGGDYSGGDYSLPQDEGDLNSLIYGAVQKQKNRIRKGEKETYNQCANLTNDTNQEAYGENLPMLEATHEFYSGWSDAPNKARVEDRAGAMYYSDDWELVDSVDKIKPGDNVCFVMTPKHDGFDHMGVVVRDPETNTLKLESNTTWHLRDWLARKQKQLADHPQAHRWWAPYTGEGGSHEQIVKRMLLKWPVKGPFEGAYGQLNRSNIHGLFIFRRKNA